MHEGYTLQRRPRKNLANCEEYCKPCKHGQGHSHNKVPRKVTEASNDTIRKTICQMLSPRLAVESEDKPFLSTFDKSVKSIGKVFKRFLWRPRPSLLEAAAAPWGCHQQSILCACLGAEEAPVWSPRPGSGKALVLKAQKCPLKGRPWQNKY